MTEQEKKICDYANQTIVYVIKLAYDYDCFNTPDFHNVLDLLDAIRCEVDPTYREISLKFKSEVYPGFTSYTDEELKG